MLVRAARDRRQAHLPDCIRRDPTPLLSFSREPFDPFSVNQAVDDSVGYVNTLGSELSSECLRERTLATAGSPAETGLTWDKERRANLSGELAVQLHQYSTVP